MDYLRAGRADALPRKARLRPRRLRLHDLHRQLGSARRGISEAINAEGLACAAVLSGNRNFEGRIHPDVRMNYLASPPLVVAYALAGTMDIDLVRPSRSATAEDGQPVSSATSGRPRAEVAEVFEQAVGAEMFRREYAEATAGDERWRALEVPTGRALRLGRRSTYVQAPALLRRDEADAGADRPTSSARACSPSSATASRPTTSRPRARSGRRARRQVAQ